MLRKALVGAFVAQSLTSLAMAQDAANSSPYDPNVQDLTARPPLAPPGEPPMRGIHWTREFEGGMVHAGRKLKNPNMIYHGGKILTTTTTQAIFWGTSWPSNTSDKISGIDSFYTGFSNSHYAVTSDEYTDTISGGHQVGASTTYNGHIVDSTAASGGASTRAILAEVCKVITNLDLRGNGYYPVYVDLPRPINVGYCAYHSAGTCGGVPVQFAFFWNLDGDAGCDPQDASGLHSQGLAALANVSAHEISEARTDPASPGAWYDETGAENGDKCNFTFGAPLVTFPDGVQWKLQGEWSNAAFLAGTGYPNASGQKGCLSGL
jgi:hypothetical protein